MFASYIRQLKPDETIAFVVQGSGGIAPKVTTTIRSGVGGGATIMSAGGAAAQPERNSTLTILAKKADVDAYAKGTLTHDDFVKKVQTAVY